MELGNPGEAIRCFEVFNQKYPRHEWISNVLFQKGLAEQQLTKHTDAQKTWDDYLQRFPKASERESVWYRKALLEGELRDWDGMRLSFSKLLKEFPKTSFLPEIDYWTGWSLFEQKKFEECLPYLERVRKIDLKRYGVPSSSRILISHFQLGHRDLLAKEVELAAESSVPVDSLILEWLADEYSSVKDDSKSEKYYSQLVEILKEPERLRKAQWGLAVSLVRQAKWDRAVKQLQEYLRVYPEAGETYRAMLDLVRGYTQLGQYKRAQESAEEILRLQPEGAVNAEARFLLGELMQTQERYEEAAKHFLSVGVLYDDPEWTPKSLYRASKNFEWTGLTNQAVKLREELLMKYPQFGPE
jgi:TolA-binding protein